MTSKEERKLFRTLVAVTAAGLTTITHAQSIQNTTDHLIPHTREVTNSSAANQHDRVLLQIVAFARNISSDLFAIRKSHTSHLSKSRVRLFGGYRLHLKTDATLLRAAFQQRRFAARTLLLPRFPDQLVNCRHKTQLRVIESKVRSVAQNRIGQSTGGSAGRQTEHSRNPDQFPGVHL